MQAIAIVEGIVQQGKKIGRTLGMPTANLPFPKAPDRPPNGIYAAQVVFPQENHRLEEGVLSQGFHPTLPEGEPTVEVFLFDCDEDLYGRLIQIRYLHYLRPETKFDSREELRVQMHEDVRQAKMWFERQKNKEELGKG